jgi:predicted TIM-barrel fold metal-dependent hydrolase
VSTEWLISVDDHVIEPPHVWTERLPSRWRDVAPRLEVVDGVETWIYEDRAVPSTGLAASAGRRREEFSPEPFPYAEMRPGCYDPVARLADMDRAGILASLCFPSVPRFCGQLFFEARDKELALLCVKAYNDWMLDEWCAAAPGRYIPLVILPLWDPVLGAAEIERCAARGVHAVAFSENPAPLGLPTIHDPDRYWEPVLQAAADAEMVVCMHVGSSSQIPKISDDTPFLANLAWGANRTSAAMLSWLFSDWFTRLPSLKIALSEGNIGWIPFFLERAEQVIDKARFWAADAKKFRGHAGVEVDLRDLDVRALYHDHVYGCFIDDVAGVRNLDVIGEDNVMVETDYPHADSTWPDCMSLLDERLSGLPEATRHKVLRGNAERVFQFVPDARAARSDRPGPPVAAPAS